MPDLVMRSALKTVEVALKNSLLLAYGSRITPAFATVAACRALSSTVLRPDELCFINSKGVVYQWNRFSTATDDGDLVINPTDAPPSGRWQKTASTVSSGYAKQVRVHAGDESYQMMLKRAQAARPSFHIVFDSVKYNLRSMSKGALYWCRASYRIKCIASSLRGQAQDIEGSDIPSETDPGTHNMVGDIIANLAGSNLNQTGVDYCEVEEERYSESAEGGRLFVEQVNVSVYYSVHQPDVGNVVIDKLTGITIQRQLAQNGYDVNNILLSGYTIPIGAGLTKTPAPGTATINGVAVSSSPGAVTFSANKDTYRDLHSDGTLTYTAVSNGATAPNIVYTGATTNTIRVGVTVTNSTGVTIDQILSPQLVNWQGVDYLGEVGVGVSTITVTPTTATITTGQTQKFTATATYTSGATLDISTAVTWVSSNTAVATIAYDGTATWVGVGTSTISCSTSALAGGNTATLTGA